MTTPSTALLDTLTPRFWSRVEITDSCWIWHGARSHGYGHFFFNGRVRPAHRVVMEVINGPIPRNLFIDHLCRNPPCCNPDHLEIVTPKENWRRGISPLVEASQRTHCLRGGHALAGDNLYITPNGSRTCRECKRAANRAYKARRRIQLAGGVSC